jgi:hypothetical protein
MPVPPKKGESKEEFISRCISYYAKKEPDVNKKQRAAICYNMWENKGKKK